MPWDASSNEFKCPCHGSIYNLIGEYQSGPAPRGMDRFPISIENEHVMVDTSIRSWGPPPVPTRGRRSDREGHDMTDPVRDDPGPSARAGAGRSRCRPVVPPGSRLPALPSDRRKPSRNGARAQDHALIVQGHQLWGDNCATCHGAMGEGVTAPALNSQEFLTSVNDDQIHGIIAGGIPGTPMPAWLNDYGGPLTDQQIGGVVAYLRSLQAPRRACPTGAPPTARDEEPDHASTTRERGPAAGRVRGSRGARRRRALRLYQSVRRAPPTPWR